MEFALAALPVLLAGLLVFEVTRWQMVRQMLDLALLEAARAGATGHADPRVIERAFIRALLPLFEPGGRHGGALARMQAEFADIEQSLGGRAWRIDVVAPAGTAFADFRDRSLHIAAAPGRGAIRNDYQAEQHARYVDRGWPQGRGPRSRMTIFDANTLRLRVVYVHRPLAPAIRAILRGIAAAGGQSDMAARAGMLTLRAEMALPMQSHPVDWRRTGLPPHPRSPGTPFATTALTDHGNARSPARPAWSSPRSDAGPTATWTAARNGNRDVGRDKSEGKYGRNDGAGAVAGDDPACGIVLCCTR